MPFPQILVKLLTRPQRHTLFSIVTATILTMLLVTGLLGPNNSVTTIAIQVMISAAISSVVLNEIVLGLVEKKRDMAILLVLGAQKYLLGIIMLGRTIMYASFSCLLGVALGYLLMTYDGVPLTLTLDSSLTLSSISILGPALVAGAYGILYISHLNVSEVLRH